MKKYTLVLFVLAFVLGLFNININSVSADVDVPGCMAGDNFSRTTGQPCNKTIIATECKYGDLFSSLTGKPCSGVSKDDPSDSVSIFNKLFKSSFRIGARGDDVKALQQFLKDEDYYFGKVDGKYGRITARAVRDFQEDNDINVTSGGGGGGSGVPIPTQSPVVISGVSGPQSLNVNQTGTWTVKASSPMGGNLSYSVIWGDETDKNPAYYNKTEQSATFTHSYSQAGIYTPTFTVTSKNTIQCFTTPCPSNGGTAQTSITVKVGDAITPTPIPFVSVYYPNGGETWVKGSTQTIKWNTAGNISKVSILLVPVNDSVRARTFAANVVNTGSYSWSIPNCTANIPCSSNFEISTGSYYIRVYDSVNNVVDESDAPFSIVAASPTTKSSITVLSPNGGEVWPVGSTQTIKWTSNGLLPTDKVNVYLYNESSVLPTYPTLIMLWIPNDGSENWTVPSYLVSDDKYRIEIKFGYNDLIKDASDAPLSVVATS